MSSNTHTPPPSSAEHDKNSAALSSVGAAIFLTSLKIIVGLLTGSLGILSEAAHSGLDLVAAAVTFFAVRVSGRPPDVNHTYGYGKVENLSALFETFLLLLTCVWIVYEAIQRLFFKNVVVEASIWAFVIMLISIVVDFTRSRMLLRVAQKYNSQALEADALHFSTDIWSSSVVIVGLILVLVAERLGLSWLGKADAIAAIVVAGIVAYVSVQMGRKTINDLLDSVPPGTHDKLLRAARVDGVQEVKQLRVRRAGPEIFTDVTVSLGPHSTLEASQEIAARIEESLQAVMPGADVMVRTQLGPVEDQNLLEKIHRAAALHNLGVHSIRLYGSDGKQILEAHLDVDPGLSLQEAHALNSAFEAEVHQIAPELERVVTHLEPEGNYASAVEATPADVERLSRAFDALPAALGFNCQPHNWQLRRAGSRLVLSLHCRFEAGENIVQVHQQTQLVENYLREQLPDLGRVVIHADPWVDSIELPEENTSDKIPG